MRWPWSRKPPTSPPPQEPSTVLDAQLDANVQFLCDAFGDPQDMRVRRFTVMATHPVRAALVYLEALVDADRVVSAVLQPLLVGSRLTTSNGAGADEGTRDARALLLQAIDNTLIAGGTTKSVADGKAAVQAILQGSAVLLIDGNPGGLAIGLPNSVVRSVDEPDSEQALVGPHDGFVESLSVNRTLLRRRLRTEHLRIEPFIIGELSNTNTALVYLDNVANPKVVEEARKRLCAIKVDALLDSLHMEELLEDAPFSLFPTLGSTERPDVCVAQLLEGNVAILTDNSPTCLFAPVTFFTFFQSPDDYYIRYPGATWARWLRLLGLLISTIMPALAVAIINYHPELLPFALFISVAEGRERVPFPLVVEILIMDITFELLREAGLRMPRAIGQALSVLGALVLGQAAIQAGLVGPHVLLIVAVTAITSFLVGRIKITQATRLLRFALLLAAGMLGILGMMLVLIAVLMHQVSLRSFGVPYMYPLAPLNLQALKDVMLRAPRWAHAYRPAAYAWEQSERQDAGQPSPPKRGRKM